MTTPPGGPEPANEPLPDPDKLGEDEPAKDVEEDLNPSIVPPANG